MIHLTAIVEEGRMTETPNRSLPITANAKTLDGRVDALEMVVDDLRKDAEAGRSFRTPKAEPEVALLPCPFCGGEADPEGWMSTDAKGPACDDCGASAGQISKDHAENIAAWNTRVSVAQSSTEDEVGETFQSRVHPWMLACFGEEISRDVVERNHRFFEESTELVQSLGMTQSEAHQLVDYVYGRDVGVPMQEVGGVMVTLAALCLANDMDMDAAGETELARIWTKVETIRAKQKAKPKHSPLPMHVTPTPEADVTKVEASEPNNQTRLRLLAQQFTEPMVDGGFARTDTLTFTIAGLEKFAKMIAKAPALRDLLLGGENRTRDRA